MSKEGEIYLGVTGSETLISTYAKEVQRDFEEFGRSWRTSGCTLKTQIMSRKYTFTINNDYIDLTTLNVIYQKCELDQPLNLKMYMTDIDYFLNFNGACPVVKMRPFSSTDFLCGKSTKIFKNVPIVFEEI